MERVFIDPMLQSSRVERAQFISLSAALLLAAGFFWLYWLGSGGPERGVQSPVLASSLVAPALGLGYYMIKRSRRSLLDRVWFSVSESGVKSMTPAGLLEAGWDEVDEVRIASRASRSRTPDILIRTSLGYAGVFMRFVDRDGLIPEPLLLKPGRGFRHPIEGVIELTPDNSQVVDALRRFAPADKIKEGVLISL